MIGCLNIDYFVNFNAHVSIKSVSLRGFYGIFGVSSKNCIFCFIFPKMTNSAFFRGISALRKASGFN